MTKYTEFFGKDSKLMNIGCGFIGSRVRFYYRSAVATALLHDTLMFEYIELAELGMLAMFEFNLIDYETYEQKYLLRKWIIKIYERNAYKEVF